MSAKGTFFCFGLGFSGRIIADLLKGDGWAVGGTCREPETAHQLNADGISTYVFDGEEPLERVADKLANVTHILISVPPSSVHGDPVLHCHAKDLSELKALEWVGYLSTTGVYGDTHGQLVDETAKLMPSSERSRRRVQAEQDWFDQLEDNGLPVHIFRLSGIYGPGRSALDAVRAGKARQIVKPGHKFSRIHVRDLATVIKASINHPNPGTIYNLCDNEAAPPADVTAYACELLGIEPPPEVSFDEARESMSAMALSFWNDNRLVDNTRIINDLSVELAYPTYREGLRAILAEESS